MQCRGLHCDSCRHGGGLAGAGVLALLVTAMVYATHRHAIDHAAGEAGRVALTALTVAAITALALAGAGAGVLVTRAVIACRARRRAVAARPRVIVLPAEDSVGLRRAVEAPGRPDRRWPLSGWENTRQQIGRDGHDS